MEANTRRAQFLDFILDLDKSIHKPYQKPNANIVYVSQKSNHPPQGSGQCNVGSESSIPGFHIGPGQKYT